MSAPLNTALSALQTPLKTQCMGYIVPDFCTAKEQDVQLLVFISCLGTSGLLYDGPSAADLEKEYEDHVAEIERREQEVFTLPCTCPAARSGLLDCLVW